MGHIAHLKNQFIVTFYFVAYTISFFNFEPLSGAPVLVRGLMLALTIYIHTILGCLHA